MRCSGLAAVLVSAFASTGCLVVSLHPIYDEPSIEFDEKLLGTWENAEDGTSVVIARGTWKSYDVTYSEGSTTLKMTAYATRIGESRFLDLSPEHGVDLMPLLSPTHALCRVQLLGDTLGVAALDYDWGVRAAEQGGGKKVPSVMDARKNLLLTSPTPALREWILSTLRTPEAYDEPVTFVRKR
jgi:hypothetical protein